MQKEKTVEFWNTLHKQELSNKEWIVQPSNALCQAIHDATNTQQENPHLLEIGCGTSNLSRDLYCYYQGAVTVVATDVSAVCIQEHQIRHEALIAASQGRFAFQVLNVLESNPQMENMNNLVLDKGCLDTLLFRSGHENRESLVHTLLDNVYKWLKDGGRYIVITPRSRITLLRDYKGFSSVKRLGLDTTCSSQIVLGDLECGDKNKNTTNECYMYVCHKDPSFVPGAESTAFRDSYGLASNEETCPRCSVTFSNFCSGKDSSGSKQCARRWRGHCLHCKGP